MMLSLRHLGAMVAVITPMFFLSQDRVTLPVPDRVTPVIPQLHRLQEYIRVRTDHPEPDYKEAMRFLNHTVAVLIPKAKISFHSFVSRKPLLLVTLRGSIPSLPSILLNSHTDVVPAEEHKWRGNPFSAQAAIGAGQLRIYGRGSQDMKSVGLQYIEALYELTASGWLPKRTIHLSFVPDEEIGGRDGMGRFVKSSLFSRLNVGIALDEGLPNPGPFFNVYYGERQTWWLVIRVKGSPGHGATMPENTASSTLHEVIGRALKYRRTQYDRLQSTASDIGEVVGVNLAFLKAGLPNEHTVGGHAMNIIPSIAEAGLDIRVPPGMKKETMNEEVERWMTCGSSRCPGVTYEWVIKVDIPTTTSRDPEVNPYFKVFKDGLEKAGIADRLRYGIFPAATDGRYLRNAGIPCFGFSPIENTPNLLHKHNEFITVQGYMNGYRIYKSIIKAFGDYAKDPKEEEFLEQNSEIRRNLNQSEIDGARRIHESSEKEVEDRGVAVDDSDTKKEL